MKYRNIVMQMLIEAERLNSLFNTAVVCMDVISPSGRRHTACYNTISCEIFNVRGLYVASVVSRAEP